MSYLQDGNAAAAPAFGPLPRAAVCCATPFAFCLALFATELAGRGTDLEGGFIFGFNGLAMLACFAIIRVARKNGPPDKTDSCKPEPPPLPPQP